MFRFSMKCLGVTLILFLGVLIGMQYANQGMKTMKGFNDPKLYNAFTVKESKKGNMEAAILGEKVTSHDLEKKKEKLQQLKAYNVFSSAGKQLSQSLTSLFEKTADKIGGTR
ncbi:YqxA family protein [Bacillus sp. MUM 13]|uniref:YqxA family protein n=1 Tax=Bacillus sp. MUM 13 TaxID=1678001 RepID=UPI0008F584BA|nr:YqxA family protein [Bacillus sp. MUM 13]OIK13115.1 hypothetical protein BIV59_06895 [Bacillus sp. MUM 13]